MELYDYEEGELKDVRLAGDQRYEDVVEGLREQLHTG